MANGPRDAEIVTGSVTKSAPTSLTSLYYLKNILANLGGAAAATLQSWLSAIGTTADAAWTTGSGTMVSLLKTIAGAALSTDPVQTYASNTYSNLLNSANAVKSGAGTLAGIHVGAAGTTITVTVYDSLTAAGTIIFGPYVLVAGASFPINAAFGTGLSVGFSATTGTPNITVTYR